MSAQMNHQQTAIDRLKTIRPLWRQAANNDQHLNQDVQRAKQLRKSLAMINQLIQESTSRPSVLESIQTMAHERPFVK